MTRVYNGFQLHLERHNMFFDGSLENRRRRARIREVGELAERTASCKPYNIVVDPLEFCGNSLKLTP